jgi:hypothetical protein
MVSSAVQGTVLALIDDKDLRVRINDIPSR